MKYLLNALILVGLLSGCGTGEPPISIETFDRVNPTFKIRYVEVEVTALVDKVEVQDIVVNRGNCEIENISLFSGKPRIPKTLSYGETVSVSFSSPCSATEVTVETDAGDWTWTYD